MTSSLTPTITKSWLQDLKRNASNGTSSLNYWAVNQSTLITTSQPIFFSLGTGAQILDATVSKCEATNHELIITTCFWAKSSSQEAISALLIKLSAKAIAQNRKIHVRICFSSYSITQKLFQTSSLSGKIYPPSSWTNLWLPSPEQLAGLDMEVKSVFVRPFSVMHPKFILVDRKLVFMPSCNVSWEAWFEGCIEMKGGIAEKLFDFWVTFWAQGKTSLPAFLPDEVEPDQTSHPDPGKNTPSLIKQADFSPELMTPQTILLPSPHHRNPRFHFNFTTPPPCPPTPLNLFLLQIFAQARRTIFIQTPNITSAPVVAALHSALTRGVDVHLVTSRKLMILEQLVTAGTITEFEIWKLRRWHRKLHAMHAKGDAELGSQRPGGLRVGYYHAREGVRDKNEPVKSHLKLVIVDEEVTVQGSGNMDRASWYTSQELGVAFFSADIATMTRDCVNEGLIGRVDYVS
ncbi:uncharacterized protein L3040_004715 [Drepanopeziza brunnea f. sp. 'multigermtubi']|uniref:Phospholipase D n=1 Tax=Marssonina brunnea f. sp. multigermtubi (strain MB_m1) TaxID=1072389 RepID=K1WKV4_MARBU|nr:phospholipase D [Drepanopeziza brunnea f. sp. 'multigermtubi' MB_m1]EKD18330.1 phospholipase D [Drepanopeziza brunnea f. sp. 'multigermtubi' MB_m1]KAJ5042158.1 hypothetical protein L3040_004715 [Drepanopeziza brunnea f. sp. 'multigermtubi']